MRIATLDTREQAFVESQRVGRLATVDARGELYVVPICYAYDGERFYTPIDEKPKQRDRPLKRVRNITETGRTALVIDRYTEDWADLGWVLIRGQATLINPGGPGHVEALAHLRERYVQYRTMALEQALVIAITPEHVSSWGQLAADRPDR